ncbi:MAG: hypothetical protein ACQETO_00710 [Pseudomonadota bacterium]
MPSTIDSEQAFRKPAIKGRGALSNLQGRFEPHLREDFNDGWDIPEDEDASYGTRMRGEGIWAELIRQRYETAMRRSGLTSRRQDFAELDGSAFKPPRTIPPATANTDGSPRQLDMF